MFNKDIIENTKRKLDISRDTNFIKDIEGSSFKSKIHVFKSSNRSLNPLEPEYKLPHKPEPKYETSKFIRDTLKVDDINLKNNSKIYKERDILNVRDIDGASPKKEVFIDRSYKNKELMNELKEVKLVKDYDPLTPV